MSKTLSLSQSLEADGGVRPYYGWFMVVMAALAMVGTLPGRTQGLGLITEGLLADFGISRVGYARMNLWATLIGSLFCLGFGRLLDFLGSRKVLTGLALLLGAVVIAMGQVTGTILIIVLLTLSRGFGQSALSVVSISLVGKWFQRRIDRAMALYTILLSLGFVFAFLGVGWLVENGGWRQAWGTVGWILLLGLAPLAILIVRDRPTTREAALEKPEDRQEGSGERDFTWGQALKTPAFWVFAIASSVYNLVASGIGLFNESILAERGFDAGIYHTSLGITTLTSLAGNFMAGWLAAKWSMNRLMGIAMVFLSLGLLWVPFLGSVGQVYGFASLMGVAGGFVIVIFFSFWSKTFGRSHLGRILGTAQMMTVLASAVGPLLLARCQEATGSYASVFFGLSVVVALLGLSAWLVKLPERDSLASKPGPSPD